MQEGIKTNMADIKKKLAICQARPIPNNIQASADVIIKWLEKAAKAGADMAIFGELFLSDYNIDDTPLLSEPQDGPAAKAIAQAAKRFGVAVVYSYSEVEDGQFFLSSMFIDKTGVQIANYRKVHLARGTEDVAFKPGNDPVVVEWEGNKKI